MPFTHVIEKALLSLLLRLSSAHVLFNPWTANWKSYSGPSGSYLLDTHPSGRLVYPPLGSNLSPGVSCGLDRACAKCNSFSCHIYFHHCALVGAALREILRRQLPCHLFCRLTIMSLACEVQYLAPLFAHITAQDWQTSVCTNVCLDSSTRRFALYLPSLV